MAVTETRTTSKAHYTRFLCEKTLCDQSAKPVQAETTDSLRRAASQAAGAAPTLRYGPAGDSAPRLRLRRLVWPKGSFRRVRRPTI